MKKLLLLTVSVALLASCGKSPEEKAQALIEDAVKKSLYKPESYDPVETKVDSAFAPHATQEYIEGTMEMCKAYKELKDCESEVKSAKSTLNIYSDSYARAYMANEYRDHKAEYEAPLSKKSKTEERLKRIIEDLRKMEEQKPTFIGYSAVLTLLLSKLATTPFEICKTEFEGLVEESMNILNEIYIDEYTKAKEYLLRLTRKAVELALSDTPDEVAIRELGEGWVAEETWAIAVFCTLRHIDDPKDAITAAVNHGGDSDSTGAVTGNIIGTIYGYKALKEQRIFCPNGRELEETLELSNIILALSDDLYTGCIIGEYAPMDTPEKRQWYERYCEMRPAGI